jgi:hypothetical protein
MAPSKEGTRTIFKRTGIAKAFFDLDLSDAGTPPTQARNSGRPIAIPKLPESPAINDAKGKHKINLLTLPVEILPTSCEQV